MTDSLVRTSRRAFLKILSGLPLIGTTARFRATGFRPFAAGPPIAAKRGSQEPGRIENRYVLFLPGEREALLRSPRPVAIENESVRASVGSQTGKLEVGESIGGWRLVAVLSGLNGIPTAVFEKHATHRGTIVFATEQGTIARIPKFIGDLRMIAPRPIRNGHGPKFERPAKYAPAPDVLGNYILDSSDDPAYENVAALGPGYSGWTLVANGETGPRGCLWLEADGCSRELGTDAQSLWAPDLTGPLFDPERLVPAEYLYDYVDGYSKRTLLGGFSPAADIGVWNPHFETGYEVMMVLPPGNDARPVGRVRAMLPPGKNDTLIPAGDSGATQNLPSAEFVDRYWNGSANDFFSGVISVWNKWRHFFEDRMTVEIPDEWLLNAARAGIALARSSYRGLEPTYQIGEGAYTKIPERSHALFPVAHYEFVWAHQLWNLTAEVEPYFQHYLDHYILPDGNFLYNTQDQVEAPLNGGVFLELSARAFDYSGDVHALHERLPVLRRMAGLLYSRYQYSKQEFPADDPRHGLIWGSPEADLGDPSDDYPDSHPYYYQNAAWTWRGLNEHARSLERAAAGHGDRALAEEAAEIRGWAQQIRRDVERSLATAMAARKAEMKQAGITPFTPFDTHRKPTELGSYENHRFMEDWWTSDWGDPELDLGHFRHREIAGLQILGMNLDGAYARTSNFMSHGTLAGRIRMDDYRPFLLTLYALCCYTMDPGSWYSPEDALLPGGHPLEGSPYGWSAVVNSELQPAMGLRWLLCYEEHDRAVVHLEKAAPKDWFAAGQEIRVEHCPTRFGHVSWMTQALSGATRARWRVDVQFEDSFDADLIIHIHPPDRQPLKSTSIGQLEASRVLLSRELLAGKKHIQAEVS
jgi:hypothetical protein